MALKTKMLPINSHALFEETFIFIYFTFTLFYLFLATCNNSTLLFVVLSVLSCCVSCRVVIYNTLVVHIELLVVSNFQYNISVVHAIS
jgi:hypothetical protein